MRLSGRLPCRWHSWRSRVIRGVLRGGWICCGVGCLQAPLLQRTVLRGQYSRGHSCLLVPESASAVRDTDDTTTGVASGDTTFTSSCQANGAFISPKFLQSGVLRRSPGTTTGTWFQMVRCSSLPPRVRHATRSGGVRDATLHSLACTAGGSSFNTWEGRDLAEPPQTPLEELVQVPASEQPCLREVRQLPSLPPPDSGSTAYPSMS